MPQRLEFARFRNNVRRAAIARRLDLSSELLQRGLVGIASMRASLQDLAVAVMKARTVRSVRKIFHN